MRLFVATNLPAAVRDAIHADAAPLREAAHAVKWVAAPALHVTLKFLGERMTRVVPVSDAGARGAVARRHAPIDVRPTEIGAFPNFRRPRVVWVGMTGETAVRSLAPGLDQALERAGDPRRVARVPGALDARPRPKAR